MRERKLVYIGHMATVHLICGSIGAGKTTYATALSDRTRAVRFSIDEWMGNLFLADRPRQVDVTWALERTARCEHQMWAVADRVLSLQLDAVFDLGLSRRDQRDRFRFRAAQTGAEIKLHFLDVDRPTRQERVRRRNQDGTGAFQVNDEMFDFMEGWFEPPADDELYGAMIVCL
ncbi:MAG: ATP-binding protein [Myxococcota bacterium]|nr:ATP-binding protein [Myxococcota bacterium]